MVVIPEHFIFLATPRTGSRALSAAFSQVEGAKESREHHVHPEDITHTAEGLVEGSSSLPMYTVIRDPYTQVRSMFYHVVGRHLGDALPSKEMFLKFIREYRGAWWFDTLLYPYRNVADEIFVYEPDLQYTAQAMADQAGIFPAPIVLPTGRSKVWPDSLLDSDTRGAINERFEDDVEFYYDLLSPQ